MFVGLLLCVGVWVLCVGVCVSVCMCFCVDVVDGMLILCWCELVIVCVLVLVLCLCVCPCQRTTHTQHIVNTYMYTTPISIHQHTIRVLCILGCELCVDAMLVGVCAVV